MGSQNANALIEILVSNRTSIIMGSQNANALIEILVSNLSYLFMCMPIL